MGATSSSTSRSASPPITTQPMDFGYQQTETVTVTLSDASPGRGLVSGTNSATTEPPPPPTLVTLSKGLPCNDDPAAGLPQCNTGPRSGGRLHRPLVRLVDITLANWQDGQSTGSSARSTAVHRPSGPFDRNGATQTDFYFGQPGRTVTAHCCTNHRAGRPRPLPSSGEPPRRGDLRDDLPAAGSLVQADLRPADRQHGEGRARQAQGRPAGPDLPALRGSHPARGLPRHRQDDDRPGAGQHHPGQPRRASSSPPTCCPPTSPA